MPIIHWKQQLQREKLICSTSLPWISQCRGCNRAGVWDNCCLNVRFPLVQHRKANPFAFPQWSRCFSSTQYQNMFKDSYSEEAICEEEIYYMNIIINLKKHSQTLLKVCVAILKVMILCMVLVKSFLCDLFIAMGFAFGFEQDFSKECDRSLCWLNV